MNGKARCSSRRREPPVTFPGVARATAGCVWPSRRDGSKSALSSFPPRALGRNGRRISGLKGQDGGGRNPGLRRGEGRIIR